MSRTEQPVDAVVIGLGWTGSIAAKELVDAGLDVVALERGPAYSYDDDFRSPSMFDAMRYSVGNELAHPLDRDTLTFRNNRSQNALPMRQIGSFNPGEGFGGSGNTWSGHSFRCLPSDLAIKSHYEDRYGQNFIPDGMTIQDFGISWDELEPHFARFERVAAVSGTAGNIAGRTVAGGNPFEGPRSSPYPLPAFERHAAGRKFIDTVGAMGHQAFPVPVANASRDFTNEYGVQMGECRVCGHCPGFACTYKSKGSPVNSIHPALFGKPNFEARANAQVVRIEKQGEKVTGVTYVDGTGEEVFQPAEMVFLCAYAFENVRLLLLSEIGEAYDPVSQRGTVGRNYSYQMLGHVDAFFEDEFFNPHIAGGGMGTVIDDWNGDNFDHGPHGFVGGGFIGPFNLGAFPVTYHPLPEGAPRWGNGWKEAVAHHYPRTMGLNIHAAVQSYRQNYLDLDPTYKDAWGNPLLRMTFDFTDNERSMLRFLNGKAEAIARAMNPASFKTTPIPEKYDITQYQTTHNVGGTAMGTDPETSTVNRYLQHWDADNLFVLGGSVFPQNTGYNPTVTLAALAYWSLDAIKSRYLANPGSLA